MVQDIKNAFALARVRLAATHHIPILFNFAHYMHRKLISSGTYTAIMATLFLAETAMLTIYSNEFGEYASPIVLFVIALSAGLLPLFLQPTLTTPLQPTKPWRNYVHVVLLLIGVVFVIGNLNNLINKYELNAHVSDIIPQMEVLSTRFLNGEMPYKMITEWGWNMYPTYQPLQWLPFCVPNLLNFDFRWWSLVIWIGAVLVYQNKLRKESMPPLAQFVLCLLPFLAVAAFYEYKFMVLAFTVELIIAAYYLLLAFSIKSRSIWVIAAGIVLCLLSRYSLILWLPLYFFLLLFNWDKKKTLWAGAIVIAGFVLIYVLPFMTRDWSFFFKGYDYHSRAALGEWLHKNDDGKAYHLFRGVGFACYFYDFAAGTLTDKLKLAQKVHLIASISSVALLGLWWYRSLRKTMSVRVFLLCSLKIYLVVFYSFIQIPYIYLMLVPLFAGLPLLLPSFVRNEEA